MYACDCDGVTRQMADRGIEGDSIRATLGIVERVAGHRPPTCPWRAFYEPIVREVLSVSWAVGGDLGGALGADPDAKLVEALGVYTRAKRATEADEQRIAAEKLERERKHAEALRKAGVRG